MKRITKYQFTEEHCALLNALEMFFDDLFSMYSPKAHKLNQKMENFENVTSKEMSFVIRKQYEFSEWIKEESKFRNDYFVLCELTTLRSNYETQESINEMIDNEQYELLALFKKKGVLDRLLKKLED